ncbi:DNA-binding protein YbaB [Streptomyces sp. LBL]|uniref:YbaB/EbfC family nucleoid-associated protein n=1 Tax=Streptomyces sp. LBL TaxID=2940562 RepID=UPI00247645F6|nr:YbaB/EbfC family nucleoid-associated protein [Streptomyces sp. LBL]MDH6630645.1 DNA-binding protein YbaB [Streptomyces sp. LBL]
MSSPYDQQIEDLLAQYREQRDQAVESRRQINEVSATATAPRQAVKVTVGAQGQVTALEFPTGAYKNMTPKDLSKAIMTAIEQARGQALEKVVEAMGPGIPGLPGGISMADILKGNFDPSALLPDDLGLPDVVREYVDRGSGVRGGGDGRG